MLIEHFEERYQKKPNRTLRGVSDPESIFYDFIDLSAGEPEMHPYKGWHQRHTQILKFLSSVPKERQARIRAEDFFTEPESRLKEIVEWLGLRNDTEALNSMTRRRHARAGQHSSPNRVPQPRLEWPTDPPPEVTELARRFGYVE
jgi:hypothetical protein